jgi:hypothetical protein
MMRPNRRPFLCPCGGPWCGPCTRIKSARCLAQARTPASRRASSPSEISVSLSSVSCMDRRYATIGGVRLAVSVAQTLPQTRALLDISLCAATCSNREGQAFGTIQGRSAEQGQLTLDGASLRQA